MSLRPLITALTSPVAILLSTSAATAQFTFTPLGHLPGKGDAEALAYEISGDGSTVVGWSGRESELGFRAAFRWTAATGMQAITSTAPNAIGLASAVSFDGSVVAGVAPGLGPFRWTYATGLVGLAGGGEPAGVSPSGDTVVGFSLDGSVRRAARWTEQGRQLLGDLPGWASSGALDISGNGTVVGYGTLLNGESVPFAWTPQGGTVPLPMLGGFSQGDASEVSEDGSIVAGFLRTSTSAHAVRWVNGVPHDLGVLPGQSFSNVTAMSADGSRIFGRSGSLTYMWTESEGMIDLSAMLAPIIPPGWGAILLTDVSADGLTLTGYSGSPNSIGPEPWIITIPAPGAALVLCVLPGLAARRSRGKAQTSKP